ncbi:hypothetical protein CC86DRAFT_462525 [Ophiobolus disseminans]|uniref:F-box domain-containing protein n=1 Tax=Ophiobolus disseminans TaxID=1469910 RepID=A0A6A7AG08_9PLEO|nr:hypothetical protein CC86DRAFT_462525 [Ophiobolus disseminans]
MSCARDRVFSTPELLEAILIQLTPIHHLLQAQRISRLFQQAIKSSPTLQQQLFFRPSTSRMTNDWALNPLLRRYFLPWFVGPQHGRNYDTLKYMEWVSNSQTASPAFLRAEASWRNMLLMQPSPRELKAVRWMHCQEGDSEEHASVKFEDVGGVTMRPVYDITESFLRDQYESFPSFGLAIHDSDDGPQMMLVLKMTLQCCGSEPTEPVLKSHGADENFRLEWECGSGVALKEWPNGRLDMQWTTDLSEERGGVGEAEWEEWRSRGRAKLAGEVPERKKEEENEDWEE